MTSVLAVAWLTLRSMARPGGALVPVAGLLLLVAALPLYLTDDGTLIGRVRLLLTYGLGLGQAGLALLTSWLAAETLPRALAEGQLPLLVTRPLPRWRLWLGAWLGLAGGAGLLLVLLAAVVIGQVAFALTTSSCSPGDLAQVRAEVLTARAVCRPQLPDFATASPPRPVAEAGDRQRRELLARWQTVPAGGTKSWQLAPLPAAVLPGEAVLRVRLQAALPEVTAVAGEWRVNGQAARGDLTPGALASLPISGPLAAGPVTVSFTNASAGAIAIPPADGPLLLYRRGGFVANLLLALLLQGLALAFLAAVGMAAGAACSFPVAALVVVGYLVVALHVPLLAMVVEEGLLADPHGHGGEGLGGLIAGGALRLGLALAGGVVAAWPVAELAGGLSLVERLAAAAPELGGALLVVGAFGLWRWQRRELGASP